MKRLAILTVLAGALLLPGAAQATQFCDTVWGITKCMPGNPNLRVDGRATWEYHQALAIGYWKRVGGGPWRTGAYAGWSIPYNCTWSTGHPTFRADSIASGYPEAYVVSPLGTSWDCLIHVNLSAWEDMQSAFGGSRRMCAVYIHEWGHALGWADNEGPPIMFASGMANIQAPGGDCYNAI